MIRHSKDVRYFVEMVGLASTSVGCVTVDNKYALIQVPPTSAIAIAPPLGEDHPTFETVVFYANCLAYEHDLPVFIRPARRKALVQPVEKGPSRYINDSYYDSLDMAFEAVNSIRLGPLGLVHFRWPGFEKDIDVAYTDRYSSVAKELSLYSTAIRQLDPLSEFLCYYRVIESTSGTNGKAWISNNLSRLPNYDFGFLHFRTEAPAKERRRRINLFSVYRRRALARLRDLNRRSINVPDYFYHENRCGIAHGKSDVKEYDFKYNVEEISRDNYALKLLSRLAMEDARSSKTGNIV